jgi:hypothetical protein
MKCLLVSKGTINDSKLRNYQAHAAAHNKNWSAGGNMV